LDQVGTPWDQLVQDRQRSAKEPAAKASVPDAKKPSPPSPKAVSEAKPAAKASEEDPMDFDKVKEILKSESPYSQNKSPWDV